MIRLITGVPGAGKSALAVMLIRDEYFDFSKETGSYVKKEKYKDTTIITDIDGFKLHDIDLNDACASMGVEKKDFFKAPIQEKIFKKYPKVVYVLDECQRFLGPYLRDQDTIFYFDYHRHYGHEVYLISQDKIKINRQITSLAEFEYRAVKRTLSIFGEFRYLILSDGEIIERIKKNPDKSIFELYDSTFGGTVQKYRNPLLKWIIIPALCIPIMGCAFWKTMHKHRDASKTQQEQLNSQDKPTPLTTHSRTRKAHTAPPETTIAYPINVLIVRGKIIGIYHPTLERLVPPRQFEYTYKLSNPVPRSGCATAYIQLTPDQLDALAPLSRGSGRHHTQTETTTYEFL